MLSRVGKIFLIIFLFSLLFSFRVNLVLAKGYDFEDQSGLADTGFFAGYDYDDLWNKPIPEIIGEIVKVVLSFLGVIFLILMIYGGYTWMIARGNEQEVEKAKSLIRNAVIGLIIVLAAYTVTFFVYWWLGYLVPY